MKVLDVGWTSCGKVLHSVLSEAGLLLLHWGLRLLSSPRLEASAADFPRLLLLMLRVLRSMLHRGTLALRSAWPFAIGSCSGLRAWVAGCSRLRRLWLYVNIILDVEFVVHIDYVYFECLGALALPSTPVHHFCLFIRCGLTLHEELLLTGRWSLPIRVLSMLLLLLASRWRRNLMGRIRCNIHLLPFLLLQLLMLLLLLQL